MWTDAVFGAEAAVELLDDQAIDVLAQLLRDARRVLRLAVCRPYDVKVNSAIRDVPEIHDLHIRELAWYKSPGWRINCITSERATQMSNAMVLPRARHPSLIPCRNCHKSVPEPTMASAIKPSKCLSRKLFNSCCKSMPHVD